jgi:hypothetical protein
VFWKISGQLSLYLIFWSAFLLFPSFLLSLLFLKVCIILIHVHVNTCIHRWKIRKFGIWFFGRDSGNPTKYFWNICEINSKTKKLHQNSEGSICNSTRTWIARKSFCLWTMTMPYHNTTAKFLQSYEKVRSRYLFPGMVMSCYVMYSKI